MKKKNKKVNFVKKYKKEDCYTISQVSEKFGANPSMVNRVIDKFKIPKEKIGNFVYVPKSEIDKNIYWKMRVKPTKCTIRLRKAEFKKEWYVYIESYPVFEVNNEKPKRVREYINRSVSTVVFDKNRSARTDENGNVSYKPKRDENGIILCKSDLDKETMLFADAIRRKLQKQYDDLILFGDNQELKQKELL